MAANLGDYAIAFLLTVVVEVGVALVLGYRRRAEVAAVFWVNVFSHPLVNFLVAIVGLLRAASLSSNEVLVLEAAVVVAEWLLLCFALPCRSKTGLLLLSLAMNAASYYLPSPYPP